MFLLEHYPTHGFKTTQQGKMVHRRGEGGGRRVRIILSQASDEQKKKKA